MKASIKLRDDDHRPPLLRAKVPISIFNLPFAASVAAGDPSDLSLHLLTSFPSLPSLKLSYHPNPTLSNPSPFTLTLKSGAGRLGSPRDSPLHISLRLTTNPNPSFSIHLKPYLGHFSLLKSAASPPFPPNPIRPQKEDGGGVHNPIPVVGSSVDELVHGGVKVRVRTAMPVGRQAGLKVRWAVRLPSAEARGVGFFNRLPYLTVDKISVERVAEEKEEQDGKENEELGKRDLEAMRGMCFWMGREVDELRKESDAIKENIEVLKKKFLEVNEREGRRGSVANGRHIAAVDGDRVSSGGFVVAGKRA